MNSKISRIVFLSLVCVISLSCGATVLAQSVGSASVQTNSATNISYNGATLNGSFSFPYFYSGTSYVYFQYGTDITYNNQTAQQSFNGNSGTFSQNINGGLYQNSTYHYRAVLQANSNTYYGQDQTFYTSNNGNYYGTSNLSVTKQVINFSSGNLNWSQAANARPGDILSFAIIMQATGGQDIHNVFVRDIFPANLIYRGDLLVNAGLNYGGNPVSGINIGIIPAGGVEIVSYQAQVAPSTNFVYGSTTLSNNATVTSMEAGTQTASASVIVNNSIVYGAATSVSTGLTNNPITDSFFLPIFLIILGSWFYFSGKVYVFADWLATKMR